jgi:hypothetical protein
MAGIEHVECRDICDMEIIVNSPEIRECLVSKAEEFLENIQGLATNVRKWDRTSVPTGHLRTQNGSNLQPKFGLSVRIRIEDEAILSPISVRTRIGHSTAYTRVLWLPGVTRDIWIQLQAVFERLQVESESRC